MVMLGSYLLIVFYYSLQGNKGFMVEAHGLITTSPHDNEVEDYCTRMLIPLLGRFNNKIRDRMHLKLLDYHNSPGFNIRKLVEHLSKVLTK